MPNFSRWLCQTGTVRDSFQQFGFRLHNSIESRDFLTCARALVYRAVLILRPVEMVDSFLGGSISNEQLKDCAYGSRAQIDDNHRPRSSGRLFVSLGRMVPDRRWHTRWSSSLLWSSGEGEDSYDDSHNTATRSIDGIRWLRLHSHRPFPILRSNGPI